jgi:response regulator RpfG family c-di-GMP phosphodiesterase
VVDISSIDVVLLAPSEDSVVGAVQGAARDFDYSFRHLSTLDELLENGLDASTIVITDFGGKQDISVYELVQLARQNSPQAFLFLLVEKEVTGDCLEKLEKLGVKAVFLKSEAASGKLAFALSQVLKANYVPMKGIDLIPETELPFAVYHLMPQRQKFLMLVRKGATLSKERVARLIERNEFYVHRNEFADYRTYVEATSDRSAKGLAKRCRVNFLALQTEFTNLVFEVTNRVNRGSFAEGQELLARCQKLCEDLLANLAEFPKAWEVINSSSIGDFGSLERSPAIAAYAGMFVLRGVEQRGLNGLSDLMLLSLLIDISLLDLDYTLIKKRREQPENLTSEEHKLLAGVPARSLERLLQKKLAIPERLRSIMMGVYENADGSGYPNGHNENKIPFESQVIRLAKEFDHRGMLKLGQAKPEPKHVLGDILRESECEARRIFSPQVCTVIRDRVLVDEDFAA